MSRQKKRIALSNGRPPLSHRQPKPFSSKATRSIIRNHHQLHKKLSQAVKEGDNSKKKEIESRIEETGGINAYQHASILGQSSLRGGDTSKVLVQWLETYDLEVESESKLQLLEIGALSATNACSRSKLFRVTRIDLNSRDPHIERQDFMERPLPSSKDDRFDIISLSLVLNYVSDATARGYMLRRTCEFLQIPEAASSKVLPLLFLVLPAPCITNSRYLDEDHLGTMMDSLGYHKLQQKISAKLVYSLWRFDRASTKDSQKFPKVEVNPGRTRNNFCIILP